MNNLLLFSEFIEKNPDLYDDILIDDATKENIYNWFMFRYICDNEKFKVFFRRSLNLYINQYNKLVELETMDIDWFVTNYLERLNINESTGNRNLVLEGSSESSSNGTNKITRTPELTHKEDWEDTKSSTGTIENIGKNSGKNDTTNGGSITNTNSGSSTVENSNNENSNNKSLTSQLPNSITYPSVSDFPNLNWETATQQEEGKTSSSSSGTNKTIESSNSKQDINTNSKVVSSLDSTNKQTNNLKDLESGSRTTKESGTEITDGINSDKNTSKNSSTQSENSENNNINKEISSGRNEDAAEILAKAREIIYNLNAFEFLREKLELCFYSLYEL